MDTQQQFQILIQRFVSLVRGTGDWSNQIQARMDRAEAVLQGKARAQAILDDRNKIVARLGTATSEELASVFQVRIGTRPPFVTRNTNPTPVLQIREDGEGGMRELHSMCEVMLAKLGDTSSYRQLLGPFFGRFLEMVERVGAPGADLLSEGVQTAAFEVRLADYNSGV